MPYIIDGHNLIPKIPGLSLEAIDDENQLIEKLQEFCRIQRKKVEVYFDKAAPGQARLQSFGRVAVRFVRANLTADQAIESRLQRMGRSTRNWTVVSSDRRVQAAARAAHAKVMSSSDFAALLQPAQAKHNSIQEKNPDLSLNPKEVEDWMELFGKHQEDD